MSTSLSFNQQTLARLYEHWQGRRVKRNNAPLMPQLRIDEPSLRASAAAAAAEHDPFVCFRKREIRTTRKTRRTDVQSVQKLRQLRSELDSARQLLEMVSRREKMRREAINLDQLIFEQRIVVREIKSRLQIPEEVIEEARAAQKKRSVKSRAPNSETYV
jgi:enhancer of polycomb-like protein